MQAEVRAVPVVRIPPRRRLRYNRFKMAIASGKGCEIVDTDGNRYLDFAAGIATCTLGHANEKLAVAVSEQMRKVNHVSNLYYIPQQGELAKRLTDTCNLDKVSPRPNRQLTSFPPRASRA